MGAAPSWATRLRSFAHRRFAARLRRLHPLNYVFWECTRRCNLACRHCGSSCDHRAEADELTTAEVLAAFDDVAKSYDARGILVAITGGEPLLRQDLFAVMAQLRDRGFKLGMVSNGWAITAAKAQKLFDHGLRTISISVDGRQRTHDFIRDKPGSHARALEALAALSAIPGLAAEALSVVTGYNLDELEAMYEELAARGVRRWRLETVIPIGRAALDPKLALEPAQTRALLHFIAGKRAGGPMAVSFGCEGWLGLEYELRVRKAFFFCNAGITVASILANGDISACPDIDRSFVQGNVRRDSFTRVWETGFREFRERTWMRRSVCADCDAWADCEGGAMHMWTAGREKLGCIYRVLTADPP